jgi:hypothetical protein
MQVPKVLASSKLAGTIVVRIVVQGNILLSDPNAEEIFTIRGRDASSSFGKKCFIARKGP